MTKPTEVCPCGCDHDKTSRGPSMWMSSWQNQWRSVHKTHGGLSIWVSSWQNQRRSVHVDVIMTKPVVCPRGCDPDKTNGGLSMWMCHDKTQGGLPTWMRSWQNPWRFVHVDVILTKPMEVLWQRLCCRGDMCVKQEEKAKCASIFTKHRLFNMSTLW